LKLKAEYRNPKQIEMTEAEMFKTRPAQFRAERFELVPFEHSGLSRISDFVFRISGQRAQLGDL
jgi:hypothetical protein